VNEKDTNEKDERERQGRERHERSLEWQRCEWEVLERQRHQWENQAEESRYDYGDGDTPFFLTNLVRFKFGGVI